MNKFMDATRNYFAQSAFGRRDIRAVARAAKFSRPERSEFKEYLLNAGRQIKKEQARTNWDNEHDRFMRRLICQHYSVPETKALVASLSEEQKGKILSASNALVEKRSHYYGFAAFLTLGCLFGAGAIWAAANIAHKSSLVGLAGVIIGYALALKIGNALNKMAKQNIEKAKALDSNLKYILDSHE